MVKKILAILLTMFIAGSYATYADDTNETYEEIIDEDEAAVLMNPYGAQVRLVQLDKNINIHLENANLIIDELKANATDVNISRLEEIVSELESLLVEISNSDMDKSSDLLAEDFVAYKTTAIELTKEFRTIVHDSDLDSMANLQEKVRERERLRLNEKDPKIEALKNRYNAERFNETFARLGIEDPEVVEKVRNGEMNLVEARSALVGKFNGLGPAEKKNALMKMREERAKHMVQARENIENRFGPKVMERMQQHRIDMPAGAGHDMEPGTELTADGGQNGGPRGSR